MSNKTAQFESMLFNYETTSRTDFRDGEIKPCPRTVYHEKPTRVTRKPAAVKFVYTMNNWTKPGVPMGLFVTPKDIIRTDPRVPQPRFDKLQDIELESVRKTRPRIVMTPAVALDDTEDSKREQILKDMYMSSTQKASNVTSELIKSATTTVVSPLPEKFADSNPLQLPKYKPPYVSPEWRMDSVSWDQRQSRIYCDPTKEFFLSRPRK